MSVAGSPRGVLQVHRCIGCMAGRRGVCAVSDVLERGSEGDESGHVLPGDVM